ncbi:MAG: PP2C family serine/threonine-protein phosphatase [Candidatus Methanospirareceae archaeon]
MEIVALSRPKFGESVSGDAYLVECYKEDEEEKVLIAVIDGLGHGKKAESTSKAAIDFIKLHKNLPLEEMVKGIHRDLIGTRGAVIGIAKISPPELSYIGIGNISAQIVNEKGKSFHLTSMSGVLGWNLRKVKEFRYDFRSGWLVMNTDGIGSFAAHEHVSEDLHAMATEIMKEYEKDDDATIVIARKYP